MAGKPLGLLDKQAVEKLISQINSSEYKETTKRDYKIILKKYFQWIRGFDEDERQYPGEVRWIKTTQKKGRLLPEALLSVEEIKKLVEETENQRDRALILTYYARGGNITSLQVSIILRLKCPTQIVSLNYIFIRFYLGLD